MATILSDVPFAVIIHTSPGSPTLGHTLDSLRPLGQCHAEIYVGLDTTDPLLAIPEAGDGPYAAGRTVPRLPFAEAFRRCRARHILLIDDNILVDEELLLEIRETIRARPGLPALAVPVRLNLNRKGPHHRYSANQELLFSYGVIDRTVFAHPSASRLPAYDGDYAEFAFFMVLNGYAIHRATAFADLCLAAPAFTHTGCLFARRWAERGLPPDGPRTTSYFLYAQHEAKRAISLLKQFAILREQGVLGILAGGTEDPDLNRRILRILQRLDADMADVLRNLGYKQAIVSLLANFEARLPLFASKSDLLDFLILYFRSELRRGEIVGDAAFWSHFKAATRNHRPFLERLVKLSFVG